MTPCAPDDPRLSAFDVGEGPSTAILIHGFTGTPFEMRWLGDRLASKGFRAIGVRLPGHGVVAEELERSNFMDWLNEVRAVVLAQPEGSRVFLVGLSMGALIAAIVAADHPHRVRGLALLAPALRLRPRIELFRAASGWGLLPWVRFVEKKPSDMEDRALQAQNPNIGRIPALSVGQLGQLQLLTRLALPKISAPALVMYSERDPTVAPAAAYEVAKRIGSRPARLVRLDRSKHILTLDVERERVADEIERFFLGLG